MTEDEIEGREIEIRLSRKWRQPGRDHGWRSMVDPAELAEYDARTAREWEQLAKQEQEQRKADRESVQASVKAALHKTLDDAGPVLTSLVDIEQVASIVFRAIERGDIPRVSIEY